MKLRLLTACSLTLALGAGCLSAPTSIIPALSTSTGNLSADVPAVSVVATGLNVPWEIAFLPAGDMLVTERPGKITGISRNGTTVDIKGLEATVRSRGEGGLLGLALHPDFSENHYVYIYLTSGEASTLTCSVERYTLNGDTLSNRKIIIDKIPGASDHDGGRIKFGPDGKLYITAGDATQENLAQNKDSLAGKILRVNDDGSIPSDNPFGTAVWTYGHRNAQGLAWDDQGRLWATEHGRSGVLSGLDELNLIEKGKNYGWPTIQGSEKKEGLVTPVINSGASETWAPSGMAYVNGHLFFAGLRGATLYEADITQTPVTLKKHLVKTYGRLRAVTVGPDGMLYVSTSNRDGRGLPTTDDDRIIRIDPKKLD